MWSRVAVRLAVATALLVAGSSALALGVGQRDDFEDGTTANWVVGLFGATHPAPPQNMATGGPAGVDDNFLQLTALGGVGPGSRLAVINNLQWTGDYTAAGGGAISLDVNNLGATDLMLRLQLSGPASLTNVAVTTAAVTVPAGSGWLAVSFPIDAAALTTIAGSAATLLTDVAEVRLIHNPNPTASPPPVTASLGVDNITLQSGGVADAVQGWGGVKALFR
jgi:hypothetical protein